MPLVLPKIVYPSQPGVPNASGLSQQAGGTQASRTEYFVITYVTANGETLASAEASIAVLANQVAVVASPAQLAAPFVATGYNVYQSTVSGAEKLVTATATAIGTSTVEPNAGWVQGTQVPPTAWGSTLAFLRPPRRVPQYYAEVTRQDSVSLLGEKQAVFFRTDNFLEFEMEWVTGPGTDATNWQNFFNNALQGGIFDYYPDGTLSAFTRYFLEDKLAVQAYKSLGQVTFRVRFRQVIP